MTGSQALIKCLEMEGVDILFGIPGGVVLSIFDALYDSKIRTILVRHEQAAAHMADGYARSTGKVGVCIATSGPGATNLVTGLATAYMDSVPMVAITGQVNLGMLGRDSFQEADITGITLPITKHNYLVKDPEDLTRVVREAFHIARTGRPGPVLIDIPHDVTIAEGKFKIPETVELRSYRPTLVGHKKQIAHAAEAIAEAERPVLYVGGGAIIAGASPQLRTLAEKIHAPVTTTLMGKGAFPETHPLSLGMLGMHGTYYANKAISAADLVIAVGARFDDRVTGRIETFARNAKIIHIDIDPAEIGKNVKIAIPIVGDAANILAELIKVVQKKRHPEWLKTINKWATDHPLTYNKHSKEILPQYVMETIHEMTNGKAYICTEVGQHQMWAAQFFKLTQPRTFISSGGLGTMGYGFPAALGVQFAHPDALVFDIAGDGSILMNIQELVTAVQHKLPVKVIILKNKYLGMVRQWQEMFFDKRYSSSKLEGNPDFALVARAFGAEGIRVDKKDDLIPALKETINNGKPTFLDVQVKRDERVMPMVPKGKGLDEMIEG